MRKKCFQGCVQWSGNNQCCTLRTDNDNNNNVGVRNNYYFLIYPRIRAQHCNYAILLAGNKECYTVYTHI